MGERNLTNEQKIFLEECEAEFKDRYTEKDDKFVELKNMKRKPPPIDPWYPTSRTRNFKGNRNYDRGPNRRHNYKPYHRGPYRHTR